MNVRERIAKIASSEGMRNLAKLLSANVFVQAVGLLVYPILTRLYSPEDFGLVNLFLSVSGVLAIAATAEFQYSVVLPHEHGKALACLKTGLALSCVCFLLLLGTIPLSSRIADLFKTPDFAEWYWLVPFCVLLTAVWNMMNYWCIRQKDYDAVCRYQATQSITNAAAKCGIGFAGFTQCGLILSAIISPFVALAALFARLFRNRSLRGLSLSSSRYRMKDVAKEYENFPKYSLPRAIVDYASGNLPILLLTPFFGLTEIGFLGMALTLAFRPVNVISNSLYQVLYQKTAERVRRGQSISDLFNRYCRTLALVAVPTAAALVWFLPAIVQFLLGAEWRATGEYIQILLLWIAGSLIVAPIMYLPDIFKRQKEGLLFELLLFAMRAAGLGVGIAKGDFVWAVWGYSIASAAVIACQFAWLRGMVQGYEKQRALSQS